ncbi:response regulator [Sphingomonas jatrophae]|uniref:Response regulator receiver domain-containing protein n=1 Tax=Sphingomonas jatrophae TaxID=1166337 RepID=A0A1I6L455_9SPHN|nr:response regulator [Sphingomonas jatrophae]SFR98229.1 Response regulator receiver domain-containing protein [Sphingomonas jatrophae]
MSVSLAGLRVLVVEDEPIVAMTLEDLLADLGCEVEVAGTLEQGLAAAAACALDAAVLDVNLNGRESFPIAEALDARRIPHLFATGYGAAALRDRNALVLEKPYRAADIRAALETLLGP